MVARSYRIHAEWLCSSDPQTRSRRLTDTGCAAPRHFISCPQETPVTSARASAFQRRPGAGEPVSVDRALALDRYDEGCCLSGAAFPAPIDKIAVGVEDTEITRWRTGGPGSARRCSVNDYNTRRTRLQSLEHQERRHARCRTTRSRFRLLGDFSAREAWSSREPHLCEVAPSIHGSVKSRTG